MTLIVHDGYVHHLTGPSTTSNVCNATTVPYISTSLLFPDKPQVRADCRTCGAPSQSAGSACRYCAHAVGE